MNDSTSLDALLGGVPQSMPPLPSATTFSPMLTPGTQTYTAPPPVNGVLPSYAVKSVLHSILSQVAIFLGIALISLTPLQSLVLRYVPHAYSGSGSVSLYGAGVLGVLGTIAVYVLQSLMRPLV